MVTYQKCTDTILLEKMANKSAVFIKRSGKTGYHNDEGQQPNHTDPPEFKELACHYVEINFNIILPYIYIPFHIS